MDPDVTAELVRGPVPVKSVDGCGTEPVVAAALGVVVVVSVAEV